MSSRNAQVKISCFLFLIAFTLSFRKSFIKEKCKISSHLCMSGRDVMVAPAPEELRKVSQMLSFVEPSTGVIVKLVGAMHYNPTSVNLAYSTCNDLAERSQLGSVVVESCPQRWNKTMISQPVGSLFRSLFDNEMQAAAEVAVKYGLPVVLGDQDISATNQRMAQTFKQSIIDLLTIIKTPWGGGWNALYNDIKIASSLAMPSGAAFLGPADFFNFGLLLTTPVSLIRYPLSFVVKAPIVGIPVVLALIGSVLSAGESSFVGTTDLERVQELATSALIFGVETSVFARVFLVALLSERNTILAANILSECQKISAVRDVEGVSSPQKVVVAILGMAHCNGILNIMAPSPIKMEE